MTKRLIGEVDLAQAESRFIAFDGPIPKMQQMYADGVDIHTYVASRIFKKPENSISTKERFLGKKSGHGRNYLMGENTFAANCLIEADLVLSQSEARNLLEGYSRTWEGKLEEWQDKQINFVATHRYLDNPFRMRRQFHDRITQKTRGEICAHRPQSTIPQIINFLIKRMYYNRPSDSLRLLNQGHDSVWFEFDADDQSKILSCIKDQDAWNPRLTLAGGELRIPIDIKIGTNFNDAEEVFSG